MKRAHRVLLSIDAIVNLVLGVLLLLFPFGAAEALGIPVPDSNFYPTILGGVIFGIGIALVMERLGFEKGIRGLGLGGAIAINCCGGLVLLMWLLIDPPAMALRGHIILWILAVVVLGVGMVEIAARSWRYGA